MTTGLFYLIDEYVFYQIYIISSKLYEISISHCFFRSSQRRLLFFLNYLIDDYVFLRLYIISSINFRNKYMLDIIIISVYIFVPNYLFQDVLQLLIFVLLMFFFAENCYSKIHFPRTYWKILAWNEARICLQTQQLLWIQKQIGVSGCWSYRYSVVLMELGVDGSSRLSHPFWWRQFPVPFIWRVSS